MAQVPPKLNDLWRLYSEEKNTLTIQAATFPCSQYILFDIRSDRPDAIGY